MCLILILCQTLQHAQVFAYLFGLVDYLCELILLGFLLDTRSALHGQMEEDCKRNTCGLIKK